MVTVLATVFFLIFAPSCDRIEEAHGFVRSDGYTIGNGVLVGCEVDGKPRLAFLTCRHVVTSRMATSNRAFGEIASKDNFIFLNKSGKGFQYVGLNEIDPRRWCTVSDLWCDIAWIALNDDEVRLFSGSKKMPAFVNISESWQNKDGGFVRVHALGNEVDMMKCSLSVYSLFSPVFGPSDDPHKQMYLKTVFPLPFSTLSFGLAMYQKPSATSSSYILLSNGPELDFYGKKMRVPMRIYDIQWSAHVNKSGSPVFATVENDADKGRALIGLVALTNDEKGEAGFISLDTAIPSIRSSLAGESAMRLSDFCARLKR